MSSFLTFDNNYVGHDPLAIDVAPVSVAADAQRAADVPHLAPAVRAAHSPRRNSRESRCLSQKENNSHSFGTTSELINLRRKNETNVKKISKS